MDAMCQGFPLHRRSRSWHFLVKQHGKASHVPRHHALLAATNFRTVPSRTNVCLVFIVIAHVVER